jgi:hypothetical protein
MSTVTADIIENTLGQRVMVDGYPSQPNRIIEYLASPCDGSSVKVLSGNYKMPLVTTQQAGSTTYQVVSGSDLYYCPPAGTKRVTYQFTFSAYSATTHDINDYKFYIDDTEVLRARNNRSAQYIENRYQFSCIITIGNNEDPANSRLYTWTKPKRLYMTFRIYGASNFSNHHGSRYWDGIGGNQFNVPLLSIISTT